MNFTRSTCKYCSAAIIWAKKGDRNVPIDFDPVERGYVILFSPLGSKVVEAIPLSEFKKSQPELLPLYRERYIPHGITCTGAR